jgi:ketosteroid isomerase-like protein
MSTFGPPLEPLRNRPRLGALMLRDAEIRELLDRSRIADTIYAYCDLVDRGDVEAVVQLFTVDGVMDLGGGAIHRGHAELRDMFTDRFRLYTTTSFHCSNIRLVRYDGMSASTTTYLYGIHDSAELKCQMHLWGRFEDDMINDSDTWLFVRRRLSVAGLNHVASEVIPKRFNRIGHEPQPDRPAAGPPESVDANNLRKLPAVTRRRTF